MNENTYHEYYYLLYKLRTDSILWIISESENKKELLERIKKIYSKTEIYYLVEKKYIKDYILLQINSKKKGFQKFILDKDCKVIYNSDINKFTKNINKSINNTPKSTDW